MQLTLNQVRLIVRYFRDGRGLSEKDNAQLTRLIGKMASWMERREQ